MSAKFPYLCVLGAGALHYLLASPAAGQVVIATDQNVPRLIDVGGSAENPAHYVIGAEGPVIVEHDYGALVGINNPYHSLRIQSGAALITQGTSMIGSGPDSSFNRVVVNGVGSSWINGDRIYVGDEGSGNSLDIEDGGIVSTPWMMIGTHESAADNVVRVKGAGSSLIIDVDITVGIDGSGNRLEVSQLGHVIADAAYIEGMNSEARFSGWGSIGIFASFVAINAWSDGVGSALTVEDGAIVLVGDELYMGGAGNYINLKGGFLAVQGDYTAELEDLIDQGYIRRWDGEQWLVSDQTNLSYGYFSDETAAYDFAGYEALNGYTIITAVPEPSTWALLAGVGVLGVAVSRRRNKRG